MTVPGTVVSMRTFISHPRIGGVTASVTLPENVSLTATFLGENAGPPIDLTAHVAELLVTGVVAAMAAQADPAPAGQGEDEGGEVDIAEVTFLGPGVKDNEVDGAVFVIKDAVSGMEQTIEALQALELLAEGIAAAITEGIKHEAQEDSVPEGEPTPAAE